ncbi:hypothetical protein HD554DRAFT_2038539 [Boletus coccyginus]|nr:hypothetical protein HD554DRAFT_2038539 [Boletus coccyginus]
MVDLAETTMNEKLTEENMITMGEDDKVPPLKNVPPSPTGSLTVKANVELPVTNPPSNDGIEWHDLGSSVIGVAVTAFMAQNNSSDTPLYEDKIEIALQAVLASGLNPKGQPVLSLCSAAEQFGVSHTTLTAHFHG